MESRLLQYSAALLLIGAIALAVFGASANAQQAPQHPAPPVAQSQFKSPSLADLKGASTLPGGGAISARAEVSETTKWIDGAMQSTFDYNCFTGYQNAITSEFVGYWGNEAVTEPKVGENFYARVVVAGVGHACAGTYANVEILLPKGTAIAIDEQNKVLCATTKIEDWNWTTVPAEDCPQKTYQGSYGWVFNMADGTPWNLQDGGVVMVAVPLIATEKMSGIATNSWLYAGVQAIDGSYSPWDNPRQGIFVAANPPTITYDKPSATKITSTTAHLHGYVQNHFSAGRAVIEWGTGTSYGKTSSTFNLTTEYNYYNLDQDLTNLKPNTTYHWRIRFTGADGKRVLGTDQTFKTKQR